MTLVLTILAVLTLAALVGAAISIARHRNGVPRRHPSIPRSRDDLDYTPTPVRSSKEIP